MVIELDRVDKWGQVVTTQKPKEPPYEETPELKLLNALKASHILVDDPNIAFYKRETEKTKQFYLAENPLPHSIVKDKVLYVYLRVTQKVILIPIFFDKFSLLYEPMEEREVQDLTWHGLPIPELEPKVTTLTQPKGDRNGKGVIDG